MKKNFPFIFLFLIFLPLVLHAQTSPEEFLGHKVGADRKLADYDQIMAYFEKLDTESGKISVSTIGQTTMGKPLIMAVITSEENMARLDTYRQIAKSLRDARDLTTDEARRLSKEGKIIVMITCSLHSTEIGASQMAMELAHCLVTGQAPFDVERILKDVIVLLVPTSNPH